MTNEEFLKTLPNEQLVKDIVKQYGEFIYSNLMPDVRLMIKINVTIDFYNWLYAEHKEVIIE